MERSLFANLKDIGIDEELAAKVCASLDPDHNATKKDILVMQEAILQHQARNDDRYYELQQKNDERYIELQQKNDERYIELQQKSDERYYELKTEMIKGFAQVKTEFAQVRTEMADICTEVGSMHRQYWITFGGLITTIASVFVVNWYFH